ncbi:hypothetical protein BDN70DRAFT_925004 [Pholiota conissans]|uniref:F-box domain-containing protein n=1 Tax=Pholiota conissans TaxID=109636 RepID=A0A9P6CNR1_9AGAR|nr:hypothetical protein BDN70DRAFT_925004 [Pholiota conissans]
MRTLLPEICDIIFAYCSFTECGLPCASADDESLDRVAPLVLTRVCRRWRTLVVGNPTLWTRVHVRPCALDPIRVRLWLARSAALPLQVTICHEFVRNQAWDASSINTMTVSLVQELLPHLHRIQVLRTQLAFDTLPTLVNADGLINMRLLEQLDLLIDEPNGIFVPYPGMLLAPKLKDIRVRDITLLLRVFSDRALRTIESLTIEGCTVWMYPDFFPHLLSTCAQLRTCNLTFPNSLFFPSMQTIELPALISLSLEWPYLFDPTILFGALRAPNLHSLRLVHQTRQLGLPANLLASLRPLAQSTPALRDLTVEGCSLIAPNEAYALLAECRALERLSILHCRRSDRFLAPLTPPQPAPSGSDSEWVCPHLTYVELGGLQDADVRHVVSFARSRAEREDEPRRGGGTYLKELALQTELYSLPRQARLVMLSGLLDIRRRVDIECAFERKRSHKNTNNATHEGRVEKQCSP